MLLHTALAGKTRVTGRAFERFLLCMGSHVSFYIATVPSAVFFTNTTPIPIRVRYLMVIERSFALINSTTNVTLIAMRLECVCLLRACLLLLLLLTSMKEMCTHGELSYI